MKENKKRYIKNAINMTPSSDVVHSQPEDCFELINKYGTYNIQPTAESDNRFPKIAQGKANKDINSKN